MLSLHTESVNTIKITMDIKQFSWKEMVNNSKGKTSISLVLCGLFGLAAVIGFIACGVVIIVDSITEATVKTSVDGFSMQCVAIATLVIGHLTSRRFTKDKEIESQNGTNS